LAKPIGCSGQRRKLQLGRLFPGAPVENIRGNVLTRLEKLDRGDYGALVLAAAGLIRLGLANRISKYLDPAEMLSAAGQGTMVITLRDTADLGFINALDDKKSRYAAEAERAFVRALDGSCAAPIAAYAVVDDAAPLDGAASPGSRLTLEGIYCPGDYALAARGSISGAVADAEKLGEALARRLLAESQAIAAKRAGKVWLVGAGPGDPGLFTLKGARVLQHAEVVLYDNLVGRGVLSRIPRSAEAIYVGKKSGNHAVPQDEIGALLVKKAAEGKRVVRLKGGDPFLFGRGGEELEGLKAGGIPFEVVPGISSALAVPAYFGIPVTHRDYCSQVHIITGHGGASIHRDIDYHALVKAGGTLIFLMGLASLEGICKNLMEAGLDPQTPGAVLEQGTTAKQRKVLAPITQLSLAAAEAEIKSPAIIMVGTVCGFSEQFSWASSRPLAGLRIGVTRPRNKIGKLSEMLAAEGAEVVELPAIRTVAIEDETPSLKSILPALTGKEWLVFTSTTGVEVFFEKLRAHKRDVRTLGGIKFAAIGSATARALEDRGIMVDLVPDHFSGDALGRALRGAVKKDERIILPRSRIGTDEVTRHLREGGIAYLDIPLYDTVPAAGADPIYRDILCEDLDWVAFTSASTVEGFVALFGARVRGRSPKALCIGTQTALAAEKYGMETAVAENATLESMIACLKEAAKRGI
jgi:uroporphyrinogen III methyltransferase/synthase